MRHQRVPIWGVALVALGMGATQSAQAAPITIGVAGGDVGGYVSRIGDFRPTRDASLAAAKRVFGEPSSRKLTSNNSCDVDWTSPKLHMTFSNFGLPPAGQTVCGDRGGFAQTFKARGRRFRTWKGLRVGQREWRINDLHPSAEYRRGSWWLKTSISVYGPGDQEFAVADATVDRYDRVYAIRGWIGAAGD